MGSVFLMPTLMIRDDTNTLRTITALQIRDASNTPRDISALWIRDTNNVPRLVFNPSGSAALAVEVFPTTVHGISSGSGTATTNACAATATGGTAPYTYLWELIPLSSDAPVDPTCNAPTSAATTFTQTSMDPSGVYTSTWKITVTDDNGNLAITTATANFADAS